MRTHDVTFCEIGIMCMDLCTWHTDCCILQNINNIYVTLYNESIMKVKKESWISGGNGTCESYRSLHEFRFCVCYIQNWLWCSLMSPKAFSFYVYVKTLTHTEVNIQDVVYERTVNNVVCLWDFMHVWFGANNHGYTKTLITNTCTKRVLSSVVTHSYMFRRCWVIFR
jgi:uncharacterized protein (UPF0276 family)